MMVVIRRFVRTSCSLCTVPMAAMPGPVNRIARHGPPDGLRLGYVVEDATREYPICADCLRNVMGAKP